MGDNYYSGNTVKLCTDNLSKEEVLNLIGILESKLSIKASTNRRIKDNKDIVWMIKISSLSLENLKNWVISYIIPDMLYKLGFKKHE